MAWVALGSASLPHSLGVIVVCIHPTVSVGSEETQAGVPGLQLALLL